MSGAPHHRRYTGCEATPTEMSQIETEALLQDYYRHCLAPQLYRRNHAAYLRQAIRGSRQQGLHCSRPWLVYWTLQAADVLGVLGELYEVAPPQAIRDLLFSCFRYEARPTDKKSDAAEHPMGGFGGGPGQLPHLASTYPAVMALAILEEALQLQRQRGGAEESVGRGIADVDAEAIHHWLCTLHMASPAPFSTASPSHSPAPAPAPVHSGANDGGFAMHTGGECDMRASYIVACLAHLLRLPRAWTKQYITPASWSFVLRCQTYEGGFSCAPISAEAHGGYGQCAMAALVLWYGHLRAEVTALGGEPLSLPRLGALGRWLAQRQMPPAEGGFNGRTNKLVDSCYSHWVGTTCVLLEVFRSLIRCEPPPHADSATIHKPTVIDWAFMAAYVRPSRQHSDGTSGLGEWPARGLVAAAESATTAHAAAVALTEAFLQPPMTDASTAVAAADDDDAGDEQYEDLADDFEAVEAAAAFLDDGAGLLLCNQRRLQDYVLRFCQHLASPQRLAPVLPTATNATNASNADHTPHHRHPQHKSSADGLRAIIAATGPPSAVGTGGLMDKPDHPNDSYHTCYSLCGASAMQQRAWWNGFVGWLAEGDDDRGGQQGSGQGQSQQARARSEDVAAVRRLVLAGVLPDISEKTIDGTNAGSHNNSPPADVLLASAAGLGLGASVAGRAADDRYYFREAYQPPEASGSTEASVTTDDQLLPPAVVVLRPMDHLLGPFAAPTAPATRSSSALQPTCPMLNICHRHVRNALQAVRTEHLTA